MLKVSVIESQGKIIATLTGCEFDAYNIIRKRLPSYVAVCPCDVAIRPAYKATAKCHPDDTFDEETGVKLARDRVIAKYNKDMQRVLDGFICDMDVTLDELEAKVEKF